jgi:estrogen-related receptor beta like 1
LIACVITIAVLFHLLQGVNVDFPPNKLKQGFGEQAVFVLDHLAHAALKSTNFTWKK